MIKTASLSCQLFVSTTLTSCALGAWFGVMSQAHAQVVAQPVGSVSPAASKPGKAASVRSSKAPAPAAESISVVGRHRSHGAQTNVSAAVFTKTVPGTSVLKVLQQLPGINVVSDDAQGLDTGGIQIFMHGFSQDQLGFTLDGIPLGEPVYRNYNGLSTAAAISSENVGHMDVTQGAGALSMPSTNSLGGGLQIYSSDPFDEKGATLAQTFGSNNTTHTYIRLDSGVLNSTGTKFYLSYMRNDDDLWKGEGDQFMQQVNAKLVQPIGDASKASFFFDYTDLAQYNYQDESLEMLNVLGDRVQNYYPNYQAAYLAAEGIYTHGETKTNDPLDVAYYSATTATRDILGGMNLDLQLTDRLRWDSVVYGHGEVAATQFTTPYLQSPDGAPIADIVKRPTIARYGFTSALTYDIARNQIHSGIWYENNKYVSNMYGYSDPLLGPGVTLNPMRAYNNPFVELWGQTYNTNTFLYYLEDTFRPISGLALHAGFKSLINTTRVGATANDEAYTGTDALAGGVGLTAADGFLPHLSADWNFLQHHELFLDVSENMRAYPQSGYHLAASPYAVSLSAYEAAAPSLKPEKDWTYQVGYRFTSPRIIASATLFHVDFSNRLQAIASGSAIDPQTLVENVGSVTMNGVDADLTVVPIRNLRIFNSVSYNKGTYENNLLSSGIVYPTEGKLVIDTPSFMYKNSADYTIGKSDIHFDSYFMGRRPFSYTNDTFVHSFWLASIGTNYDLGRLGAMKNVTFSFNVSNLFNSKYISEMGGEGGSPLVGDYQSLLPGAPRQYFGGVRASF